MYVYIYIYIHTYIYIYIYMYIYIYIYISKVVLSPNLNFEVLPGSGEYSASCEPLPNIIIQ